MPAAADDIAALTATTVRVELARQGISQRALAEKIGLSEGSLSHRLSGRTELALQEVTLIAAALGVDEGYLLGVAGRDADKRGQHTVSPTPPGELGSRERLDRPATSNSEGAA